MTEFNNIYYMALHFLENTSRVRFSVSRALLGKFKNAGELRTWVQCPGNVSDIFMDLVRNRTQAAKDFIAKVLYLPLQLKSLSEWWDVHGDYIQHVHLHLS